MTDQMIPAATDKDRSLAREWAMAVESNPSMVSIAARSAARVVLDTVPAPVPPTLADMTDEERAACRWMQADVANRSVRYVIATPDDGDGEAALIAPDGKIEWRFPDTITPRPDLPRMEWPGTDQGGEGVTTVGYVSIAGDRAEYDPWAVARLPKKPDTSDTVPENSLAVGSEWDDTDALALECRESGRDQIVVLDCDGYAFIWDEKAEWWEGYTPPQCAPYTIIHIGREADQ